MHFNVIGIQGFSTFGSSMVNPFGKHYQQELGQSWITVSTEGQHAELLRLSESWHIALRPNLPNYPAPILLTTL